MCFSCELPDLVFEIRSPPIAVNTSHLLSSPAVSLNSPANARNQLYISKKMKQRTRGEGQKPSQTRDKDPKEMWRDKEREKRELFYCEWWFVIN